ncbi:hypothetical protein H6503_02485 [Candidatus Woesearchaeota archaeon]|nr:hypothetical protein [Candidatus Woesearchaeota archaeon]
MKYINHNPRALKVHVDRYNIDFMYYFTLGNFIWAVFGSIIGVLLWLFIPDYYGLTLLFDLNQLYAIFFIGGASWFIFTSLIVYFAGNSKFESARLSGRRGLFTFSVMLLVTLVFLIFTSRVAWNQQFYYFLKYVLTGMIASAFFAVPFDYGISAVQGILKKKKMDILDSNSIAD